MASASADWFSGRSNVITTSGKGLACTLSSSSLLLLLLLLLLSLLLLFVVYYYYDLSNLKKFDIKGFG